MPLGRVEWEEQHVKPCETLLRRKKYISTIKRKKLRTFFFIPSELREYKIHVFSVVRDLESWFNFSYLNGNINVCRGMRICRVRVFFLYSLSFFLAVFEGLERSRKSQWVFNSLAFARKLV